MARLAGEPGEPDGWRSQKNAIATASGSLSVTSESASLASES